MNGLNNGLINGFSEVQSNVSDMANQIQQAITNPGFDIGASIGNIGVNHNLSGGLTFGNEGNMVALLQRNNELTNKLLEKDLGVYLDGNTLVGGISSRMDARLGNETSFKDRWSR